MVKQFCAVAGVGSVFAVDIGISETVGDLKKKITEKEEYGFPASKLKLYLAKRGNSWLSIGGNDIKALQRGETPDTINVLMKTRINETRTLKNRAYLGAGFTRVDDDIHVLVELPDEPDEVAKCNRWIARLVAGQCVHVAAAVVFLQALFGMDKASQTKKKV